MVNLVAEIAQSPNPLEAAIGLACAVIALAVARIAGAFRPGSIAGPPRLPHNATSLSLWITLFAAIAAQLLLPGIILVPFLGPLKLPLSAHQTAILFPVSSLCGLAVLLIGYRFQEPRWRMSRRLRPGILPAIVGACVAIPLVVAVSCLTQETLHLLRMTAPEGHALLNAFNSGSLVDRSLVIISAVIIAPIAEEMFFRGLLQTAVRHLTRSPWIAVMVTALLFGLVHGAVWMFPPLLALAIVLGYIYERTGNLYATIFIHASFNAIMIGVDALSLSHR